MARFSDEQISRIKSELDVRQLAEGRGVVLAKEAGGQWKGLCPFHKERNPSFKIDVGKNVFHCFGCDRGGSPIDFVMQAQDVAFREAVEWILDQYPHLRVDPEDNGKATPADCPLDGSLDDQQLLRDVLAFYHRQLLANTKAQAYLQDRGIADMEAIKQFQIGFADRELGRVLPSKGAKAGREIRSRLTELGIYRASGHAHFNGCVVFPVLDGQNQVREIYGRKIHHNLRKGTDYHLYLAGNCRPFGERRGVWNVGAVEASEEIILCESIIDALTFWCAGYRNVTTVYGDNGLNDDLLEAVTHHAVKRLLLAYDRDDAGNGAAEKHAKRFLDMGVECYRVTFPAEMDANEYALKVTPAHQSLGVVLRSASWMGNGKPTRLNDQIPMTNDQASFNPKPEATASGSGQPSFTPDPQATASEQPNGNGKTLDSSGDSAASRLPSLAASPVPRENAPAPIAAEVKEQEITFTLGDRTYRVRGLERNHSYDQLKVNVLVRRMETFHVDTFDVYQSRPRAAFVKQASNELGLEEAVIKRDLGKVLLKLEQLQDEQIRQTLTAKEEETVELSAKDRQAALELLKDPNLLDRILEDFERCGIVGEETNKLVAYLAAVSRKLDEPLAVLLKSCSAAGKTSLMDAVLAFVPPEDKVKYSAMTGQSLFYMGDMNLKHKVLAISEEEGVRQAA